MRTFYTSSSRACWPGRAAAASGLCARSRSASASAPGGSRVTRWPGLTLRWSPSDPGGGCAQCPEPPPRRQARCASRSARPLRAPPVRHGSLRWGRGSPSEGPGGSRVNGLTPGSLRLLGRLTPAGQGPAVDYARIPLPPLTAQVRPGVHSRRLVIPERRSNTIEVDHQEKVAEAGRKCTRHR